MKKVALLGFTLLLNFTAPAFAEEETVNLQWSICDASPEVVLQKIGSDGAKMKQVPITYFDTAAPSYLQTGVTLRLKTEDGSEVSSLKIRFPAFTQMSDDYDCQFERYGSDQEYACELSGAAKDGAPVWTADQRAYLARYHGDAPLLPLKAFGPYKNRKWKLKNEDGEKVTFDSVDVPGLGYFMEFALKVPESEADQAQASYTAWLQQQGVKICEVQEAKTYRLFRQMGLL